MILLFSIRVAELQPNWERVVYSVTVHRSLVNIYQFVRVLLSLLVIRNGIWDLIVLVHGHYLSFNFSL